MTPKGQIYSAFFVVHSAFFVVGGKVAPNNLPNFFRGFHPQLCPRKQPFRFPAAQASESGGVGDTMIYTGLIGGQDDPYSDFT